MDWLGLISLLAAGYAVFVCVCAWHIARRLRRPPRRTYAWALSKGLPGDPREMRPPLAFESREVEWRGVAIPVWDVAGAAAPADGPVIVLTPGWGDSRVGGLVRLPALARHASRVILWDPPGLGASEIRDAGKGRAPVWSMSTRDHEALIAVLDECVERSPRSRSPRLTAPVILYGWSAGGGSSIVAAANASQVDRFPLPATQSASPPSPARGEGDTEEEGTASAACGRAWRIAGVIAEAPYRLPWTPARNVIRAAGLPWFFCGPLAFAALGLRVGVGPRWRGFDRAAHAANLKGRVPLLVLHGSNDEVCPIDDGRAIANAAGGEFVEIPGGRHNDLWVEAPHKEACERAIAKFLQSLPSAP